MISRDALVVGALLHDIGKFEFRTSDRRTRHTTYGDLFVGEYLNRFRCLAPILEEVRRLVAHHHDRELGDPLLREADHLAAADRQVDGSPETLRSLVSILAAVEIGKGSPPNEKEVHRYAPGPVDFANPFPEHVPGVTPAEWKPDREQAWDEHTRAWEQFCGEVEAMPDGDLASWIETFLAVARKHLSRVASAAYKSHPDISLYDHARSVAAIAVCLHEAHQQTEPFLLIQGDISGVQSFLYKLASPAEEGGTKNTAKRLRGRSLFLVLLAETVARYYLRKLNLPPTNLLYCGGGHFSILAPHTDELKTKLAEAEEQVNRWLTDQHRGDLALVSAATSADKELLANFPRLMQQSGYELGRAKRQKFRSVLDERLFALPDYDQTMDVCPVCQADFVKGSGKTCMTCKQHVETGSQIVRAKYLVRFEGENLDGEFAKLGFAWQLADDRKEAVRLIEETPTERVHVERLNDSDFLTQAGAALGTRHSLSFGFRPLGQYAPIDEQERGPLDFEHLAQINSEKYPLLGVVRLDVDALGAVFASGLGEQRSLSRTATLSRELETFFSGYVNTLAKDHYMYITYAGGDDLFAVGSWINALEFSRALRRDFDRFSGGNSNLTFSGGLLFCKPDFPIGRAAEAAGKLEERAKSFPDKNAACLFGEVICWKRLDKLLAFGDELLYLVTEADPNNRLPRSFVHRLLSLGAERRLAQEEGKLKAEIKTQMQLKYLVARRGATSKAISANQEMEADRRRIGALGRLVNEPELMRQIAVPASYVLYKTRNLNTE